MTISPVSSDGGGYTERDDGYFVLDGDDCSKWVCASFSANDGRSSRLRILTISNIDTKTPRRTSQL